MNSVSTKQIVWVIPIIGSLSIPFVYAVYMFHQLYAGAFPPDSDAIMIPIAGVTLLWMIIGILVGLACLIWKIVLLVKGNR